LDAQGNSFPLGLMDYHARFFDESLGRFISPDSITPGGPQGLNRFAYVHNSPINFIDPSGHNACAAFVNGMCVHEVSDAEQKLISENGATISSPGASVVEISPTTPASVAVTPPAPIVDPCKIHVCGSQSTPDIPLNPTTNASDTEGTPDLPQMTNAEKTGMALTTGIVDLTIILPIEYALFAGTIDASAACLAGQVEFCVMDIPIAALDLIVADFAVSLTLDTYESISSGQQKKFKWIIIPAILGISNEEEK
jgi:RHS repeat-associated protein